MRPLLARSGLNRTHLLLTGLFLVALYVIIPQLKAFHASWHLLLHPAMGWVVAAVGLTAGTYLAAAATYYWLAYKPLRYGTTVLIQLAAMFVNRLLPGGVGALGVNYAYLHRMKHSAAQAGSIVALNNLMGVLGHTVLISLALALSAGHISVPMHDKTWNLIGLMLVVSLVVAAVLAFILRRQAVYAAALEIRHSVANYRRHPVRLPAALASSMLLTLANVLALGSCALALGVHLPFIAILIIFSFGIGASTAIPTPGGLGGFEAGLTAGLVAYHADSSIALAIALLYRLISYWLPLLAGSVAFIVCQKRRLLSL